MPLLPLLMNLLLPRLPLPSCLIVSFLESCLLLLHLPELPADRPVAMNAGATQGPVESPAPATRSNTGAAMAAGPMRDGGEVVSHMGQDCSDVAVCCPLAQSTHGPANLVRQHLKRAGNALENFKPLSDTKLASSPGWHAQAACIF